MARPSRKQAALSVQVCAINSPGLASAASELRKQQSDPGSCLAACQTFKPGFDNQSLEIF